MCCPQGGWNGVEMEEVKNVFNYYNRGHTELGNPNSLYVRCYTGYAEVGPIVYVILWDLPFALQSGPPAYLAAWSIRQDRYHPAASDIHYKLDPLIYQVIQG